MSNPVILYGTAEDGSTLPVQVDATGRLVAQGLPGPEGPEGPPGAGELPPDPQEGQVLGWENGQLAWVTAGGGFFDLDFLLIAGGGSLQTGFGYTKGGGGAGGLFNTCEGELSGGGIPALGPRVIGMREDKLLGDCIIGGPGQDSAFSGRGFSYQMKAGGRNPQYGLDGGSGAGGAGVALGQPLSPFGKGEPGQGFDSVSPGESRYSQAYEGSQICITPECTESLYGSGGGGAGGSPDRGSGGDGIQSSITGTPLWYAAGGRGKSNCQTHYWNRGQGYDNYGAGAGDEDDAQGGVLILRHPKWIQITMRAGGTATLVESATDTHGITTITGGLATLQYQRKPGVVMDTLIDRLRQKKD